MSEPPPKSSSDTNIPIEPPAPEEWVEAILCTIEEH